MEWLKTIIIAIVFGLATWALKELYSIINKRMDTHDKRLGAMQADVYEAKEFSKKMFEQSIKNTEEIKLEIKALKVSITDHTDSLRNFKTVLVDHNEKIRKINIELIKNKKD